MRTPTPRLLRRASPLLLSAVGLLAAGCGGRGDAPSPGAPTLERAFRVDSLSAPESVAWDPARRRYLVTLGPSDPGAVAGGRIAAVTPAGDSVDREAYGPRTPGLRLERPRGIAVRGDTAWIADGTRMLALDLAADSVLLDVSLDGARLLNDVAVDDEGTVYATDTEADVVWRLGEGREAEPVPAPGSLRAPNGLLADGPGDPLLIAGWEGAVVALNPDSSMTLLAESPQLGHLDGLQRTAEGDLLVSDFGRGRVELLRRDRPDIWRAGVVWLEGLQGPADILLHGSLLLVPELVADRLTAFRIRRPG